MESKPSLSVNQSREEYGHENLEGKSEIVEPYSTRNKHTGGFIFQRQGNG
jgi:hypothetical protein